MNQELLSKIRSLPEDAGVYIFKNEKGQVLYVGKAKNILNRVSSYFQSSVSHYKTQMLVERVDNVEIIICANEVEAFLAERSLIKHHHPMFNINLKDDKQYPYLRVNLNDPWPIFEKVRKRKDDGAHYLGPFSSASQLKKMLQLMYEVFPLVRCSPYEFSHAKKPCNYYQIKMCLAPCTLPVVREDYLELAKNGIHFLEGKNREVLNDLKRRMKNASDQKQYEKAAQLRDQIKAFETITMKQSVVIKEINTADVFAITVTHQESESIAFICVMTIRGHLLIASDTYEVMISFQSEEEILNDFLMQYYGEKNIPEKIIVPLLIHDFNLLTQIHSERKIDLMVPKTGKNLLILNNAKKNADYACEEYFKQKNNLQHELKLVQDFLQMKKNPERIECVDISNLQGKNAVASIVCFINGKPAKKYYRHYTVKSLEGEQDDFQSIYEVVKRRLVRGIEENDLPDLLVVDGGKGQLHSAVKARNEVGDLNLTLIGLAKSRLDDEKSHSLEFNRSEERIFFENIEEPKILQVGTSPFRILTSIRDEAHRFAITHHRKKRKKQSFASELEKISGVGSQLRIKLLTSFGSLEKISQASMEQLMEVQGVSEKTALNIHAFFRS